MEKLVNSIQGFNIQNETELKQMRSLLQKEETTLIKNINSLDEVLNILDPATHSLAFTYILSIKAASTKLDTSKFMLQSFKLITNSQGNQIRLVPGKFAFICKRFSQICLENHQAIKAVRPLKVALVKLRPNSETLTPIHADFVQCCLMAKCYQAALPIIEEQVYQVSNENSTSPRDFLLYFYYSALILLGLKQFKQSLFFLKQAISAPAVVLSSIMVESYKKYVLVCLLVEGKVIQIPRFSSSSMQRHHKNSFPQYQEFANAYTSNNLDDVHKIAQTHVETFTKDLNFGLVKQCIQSLYRRNIQKFTQTYLTFSIEDMAKNSKIENSQEAERFLLRMIEKGEIFSTINQKDGMVSFYEDTEQYDTTNILNYIDSHIQTSMSLGKKLKSIEESIIASPQYIQKTSMHEKKSFGEFEDSVEGMDRAFSGRFA